MTKFDPMQARQLILRGESVGKLARRYRMTAAELYAAMANAGLPVRDLKEARKSAMRLDLSAGKSVDEVAAKYGSSIGYVNNVRREMESSEKA